MFVLSEKLISRNTAENTFVGTPSKMFHDKQLFFKLQQWTCFPRSLESKSVANPGTVVLDSEK